MSAIAEDLVPKPIQNLVNPDCSSAVGDRHKRILTVMRIALAAAAVHAMPCFLSLSPSLMVGASVASGLGAFFLSKPITLLSIGWASVNMGVEVLKTAAVFGGFLIWAEGAVWVLGGFIMIQNYDYSLRDGFLERNLISPLAESIAAGKPIYPLWLLEMFPSLDREGVLKKLGRDKA